MNIYLNMIILLLDSVVNWKKLMLLRPNNKKYHYKTIYNKFTKWSRFNVFKFYNSLNYIKINHKILDLFIYLTLAVLRTLDIIQNIKKRKQQKYHALESPKGVFT